jgi:tight adherence protein B
MLAPNTIPIIVVCLATLSALGLLAAIFYSRLDKDAESKRRLAAIAASGSAGGRPARQEDSKRKDIERTLHEIEEKQKALKGSRPSLFIRMRQADLAWSTRTYYVYCGLVGCGTSLLVTNASNIGLLPALGFGATAGLLGPHLYVSFLRRRRFKKFTKEFPNAVDVIVRGVKSGLPVVDCLRIISVEAQEPVRSEFKEIVEDQTLGLPLDQAVQRLSTRIPLAEARFFAIVISMQSRTGGSLSDALGGLSRVLRERQKMQAKIRAMSTEATTSAGIIGSLPVAMIAMMKLASPKYIDLMFTTFAGNMILAACVTWMLVGVFVMAKMIKFDF